MRHSSTAGFKLTKLFGIYDFSVEKDSGKVLIIIIYCFYNYYYYYYYYIIIIKVKHGCNSYSENNTHGIFTAFLFFYIHYL